MRSASPHPLPLPMPLPRALIYAAARLDAPTSDWDSVDHFVDWTRTEFTIAVSCCARINNQTGRRYGWLRHRIGFDPHTGTSHPVTTSPAEAEKVTARHTLWALEHGPDIAPTCQRITPVLTDWVGPVHPGPHAPWSRGKAHDRMLDVRTVLRGVQYLDADLGHDHLIERWLAVGAPAEVVAATQSLLAAAGLLRDENRVLGRVEYKMGLGRHPLKVGQPAVTDAGWLRRVIADFVGYQLHVPHEQVDDFLD